VNSRWEERIERTRAQMEILHQAEQPCSLVLAGLPQTLHHADLLARIANAVALHAVVSHLALLGGQPRSCQGSVGKQEEPEDGYKRCYRALTGTISKAQGSLKSSNIHDEEPPPARNTIHAVQACEYSRSNQPRESRRQNLRTVQQRNTGCNLCLSSALPLDNRTRAISLTFPRIKDTQHISSARIERRLSDTKKEPTRNQPTKILHQRRTTTHNRPDEHPRAHVDARLDARDEHVAGDLHEDVADEEDGDGGVELNSCHTEVFFQVVQTRLGDGVAVDVVLSFMY
jgi:hypothetical protein